MPKGFEVRINFDSRAFRDYLEKWAQKIEKEIYWINYFRGKAEGQYFRLN